MQSNDNSPAVARLVSPHGGRLIPLIADVQEIGEVRARAAGLTALHLGTKEVSDLIMLAIGAFSPLNGFMSREDYTGDGRTDEACKRHIVADSRHPARFHRGGLGHPGGAGSGAACNHTPELRL